MTNISNNLSASRRALNMIWTAAEEYGYDPAYIAFRQDGEPDFYTNSIIGYVRKWYDHEIMDGLFDLISRSMLRETLDGVLWIALENCAYEKEVPFRPVLKEMRISCARAFFAQQHTRSRQQWMAQNSLVYALQEARWRTVLGKEPRLLNPWEKRLFHELSYSGGMTSQEIADRTLDLFSRYFHFDKDRAEKARFSRFRNSFTKLFSRFLPTKMMRAEELNFVRSAEEAGGIVTSRKGKEPGLLSAAEEQNNRIYIENCFGAPLYGDTENERLEQYLCTDAHSGCHIYFTDGGRRMPLPSDAFLLKTIRDAQAQGQKNRAHFREKQAIYKNSITRLSEQIRNALLVYPQPLKVRSPSGTIHPPGIWRAVYLDDERVFTDTFEEEQPDFSVDLMLDASASRLESQEIIAAQGYVITESLRRCGIPVQLYSFLSLRGYTVMRRYCSYTEKKSTGDIFDYFASGWNRDGLAMRGAGHFMESSPAKNRILIVLTDASPNDDRKLPPDRQNGRLISSDYSGKAGTDDTLREVKRLRKSGVKVMAVLNGEDGNTEAARKIYGEEFVRIKNIGQFSNAVGTLIQKQVESLSGIV